MSKSIDLAAVSGRAGVGMMRLRRGRMGPGPMPNGAPHTLARFKVRGDAGHHPRLPGRLTPDEAFACGGALPTNPACCSATATTWSTRTWA